MSNNTNNTNNTNNNSLFTEEEKKESAGMTLDGVIEGTERTIVAVAAIATITMAAKSFFGSDKAND